eukprot:5463491-Prymnesium_polylepis.3
MSTRCAPLVSLSPNGGSTPAWPCAGRMTTLIAWLPSTCRWTVLSASRGGSRLGSASKYATIARRAHAVP